MDFYQKVVVILCVFEVIRVLQNSVQLWYNHRKQKDLLDGLDDITNEDIRNQRKVYKLLLERLEDEE